MVQQRSSVIAADQGKVNHGIAKEVVEAVSTEPGKRLLEEREVVGIRDPAPIEAVLLQNGRKIDRARDSSRWTS